MRFYPLFPARRWIRLTILAMPILIGGVGLANAQVPAGGIFTAARTGVQKNQLSKSEQVGFSIMKIAFSDIPADGGLLIGFEVQLGKFVDHEMVNAIKPIYVTAAGDITTNEFGAFGSKPGKKKDADPTRIVRVAAPGGYAVGSITVRKGLYIDGLRLTFHRIKGNALDTKDAVVSDWIGSSKTGHSEKTLGGDGAAIVGIFGNKDERRVLALGVYQLPAAVVALPRPVPQPREDRPVITDRKPDTEKIAVVPAKRPADEVHLEPAGGIQDPVAQNKEERVAQKAQGQGQLVWMLLGIIGCLSVVTFIGCWLAFGGTVGDQATTDRQRRAKKTPQTRPPPLPPDLDEVPVVYPVDSTAVKVKPSYRPTLPPEAISVKPSAQVPGASRLDASPTEVPSNANTQPPYFHARAVYAFKPNRFYRVYVLPEMLLFLDAGAETKDQYTRGIGAAGAFGGGLLGAALGQSIGTAIDSTRGDARIVRKALLDTANTAALLHLSSEGGASFRVAPADLHDARIDPTSLWHTMNHFGNKYVGLLCFHHMERGKMTLEIPASNDMQIALAELPGVFGDGLAVNVVLDRGRWKYVRKSA